MYIPLDSRLFITLSTVQFLFADDLDIALSAPCSVDPKLEYSDFPLPKRSQLAVPIDPGIITGWPRLRYLLGISFIPRENALVAPFLCTTRSQSPRSSTL